MVKGSDSGKTWETAHRDLTDAEWAVIADLVRAASQRGSRIGRPPSADRRQAVNGILFVAATGCQWRAMPERYGRFSTVNKLHVQWSRDGTWRTIVDRLSVLVREAEGRESDPSAGIVDSRSVRGAATVTKPTRGYDAGKKVSGRKLFAMVDTLGLLIAVFVAVASTTDNDGGIELVKRARDRSGRLTKVWHDTGFKLVFQRFCGGCHISAEEVRGIHPGRFEVEPHRWKVERTFSWLMNHRRLQVDYERHPIVTEGFVWAAHAHLLLRRLNVGTT